MGAAQRKQPQKRAKWNWEAYGGEAADAHYVPLDQINKSNVAQLKVAWTYPTQDESSYRFNPIEVNGVVYLLARDNSLVAINASNGKEIWVHAGLAGIADRGIAYWQSKDGMDRRLIFAIDDQMQEINAETGKSILSFGNDGYVDLRTGLRRPVQQISVDGIQSSTPGRVYGDMIIVGSTPLCATECLRRPSECARAVDVLVRERTVTSYSNRARFAAGLSACWESRSHC